MKKLRFKNVRVSPDTKSIAINLIDDDDKYVVELPVIDGYSGEAEHFGQLIRDKVSDCLAKFAVKYNDK